MKLKQYKKQKRRLNKMIKIANKQLMEDVFKDRFYIKSIRSERIDGILYYLCAFIDREDKARTEYLWIHGFSARWQMYDKLNHLIVFSDFWEKYYAEGGLNGANK